MLQQSPAKTKRFLNAINKAAMQKCNDIAKQIEQTTAAEMERAEEEARRDGHLKIDAAKAKIEAGAKMQVAQYENEKKRELYSKRNNYRLQVFEEAAASLKEFAQSGEYNSFLKNSVASLSDKVGKNPIFSIKPGDAAALIPVQQAFVNAEIHEDASIQIGGYKAFDSEKNILIDDTLDAKLKAQQDWFLLNSNLKVEF